MEKTKFSFGKAMVNLKSLKFLTLSVVFTLLFMGVGLESNAQAITPSPNATAFTPSTFKGMDFVADKQTALNLIQAEVAALQSQNANVGGMTEIEHTLRLFYYKTVGQKIQGDLSIPVALASGYTELVTYADDFHNGSAPVTGIVNDLVGILDL